MRARRHRLVVAAALMAGSFLLGACGSGGSGASSGPSNSRPGDPVLDTSAVKQALVAKQRQATPDLAVTEARCPPTVALRKGVTFGCSVVVEDLPAPYTVTLTSVDTAAKTAQYDLKPTELVLSTAKVLDAARAQAKAGDQLDCGTGNARLATVGTIVECAATNAAGSRSITFRVADPTGKLVPAP
ncbi:MAG: DUF4333 domain-containing protein [Acidimicrobiales bacterium]